MKKVFEIDGNNFNNLEEFSDEFSNKVLHSYRWNGNLDAFNDILSGGFGTLDDGFILVWKNSETSKEKLGYSETANWLENDILRKCHPANIEHVKIKVNEAKLHKGLTLFDIILDIIKEHKHIKLILA